MRNVVKLRRIVDGAEETGQIIEKRIVAATDINFERVPIRRIDRIDLIGVDDFDKAPARKPDEINLRSAIFIDSHPDFRRLEARIPGLDRLEILEHYFEAVIIFELRRNPRARTD